jgi:hypothetical protein
MTSNPEVISSSVGLVTTNALVLTEPINLETIVSKVVWSAAGRNAPQPPDSPETLGIYRRRVFTNDRSEAR